MTRDGKVIRLECVTPLVSEANWAASVPSGGDSTTAVVGAPSSSEGDTEPVMVSGGEGNNEESLAQIVMETGDEDQQILGKREGNHKGAEPLPPDDDSLDLTPYVLNPISLGMIIAIPSWIERFFERPANKGGSFNSMGFATLSHPELKKLARAKVHSPFSFACEVLRVLTAIRGSQYLASLKKGDPKPYKIGDMRGEELAPIHWGAPLVGTVFCTRPGMYVVCAEPEKGKTLLLSALVSDVSRALTVGQHMAPNPFRDTNLYIKQLSEGEPAAEFPVWMYADPNASMSGEVNPDLFVLGVLGEVMTPQSLSAFSTMRTMRVSMLNVIAPPDLTKSPVRLVYLVDSIKDLLTEGGISGATGSGGFPNQLLRLVSVWNSLFQMAGLTMITVLNTQNQKSDNVDAIIDALIGNASGVFYPEGVDSASGSEGQFGPHGSVALRPLGSRARGAFRVKGSRMNGSGTPFVPEFESSSYSGVIINNGMIEQSMLEKGVE